MNRIAATASIDSVLNGSVGNLSFSLNDATTLSAVPIAVPQTSSSAPNSSSKTKKVHKKVARPSSSEDAKNIKKLKRLKYLQEKLLKQQQQAAGVGNSVATKVDSKSTPAVKVDSELISEMHKLTHQLLSNSKSNKSANPLSSQKSHTSSSPITNEISKVRFDS